MYKVVNRFVDRRTGRAVAPGDPLPKGMTEERVKRLVRAGCVKPAPDGWTVGQKQPQGAAGEGGAPDSFPDRREAGPGTAAVAGGAGGASGERPQPDGGAGFFRKGEGKDAGG